MRILGKQLSILTDPEASKSVADVVLLTAPTQTPPDAKVMVIDGPGEYEIRGAGIYGTSAHLHIDGPDEPDRGTIYALEIDDFRVAILGNITPKLDSEQLGKLGQPDVLIIPVGGKGLTLDASAASEIVSSLEPRYVIPVHYDDGSSKYPMPQDKVKEFLNEVGASPEPVAKLKLIAKDMPTETSVVVLTTRGNDSAT